ncbi:MAG TPA: hypothetical protein VK808_08630 [Bacteroidia bacterium]|nr:hypothetical protein [Bacteroidia bacterium]
MNFKKIPALLALSAILYTSCNNKINILAPYKDVSVVYGLMDQNDAIHYIRINKAYEGLGNAYTMAQVYDSIYYPVSSITAVLRDSNTSTSAVTSVTLDTTTTVPLGPGTFSYPKQLLYYTKEKLNPNDYYSLVVTNTRTGKKLTGSTSLLSDISFNSPSNFTTAKTFYIDFNTQYPPTMTWTTTPNTRIYQLTLRFYYTETQNGDTALKSFDEVFAPQTSPILTGGVQLSQAVTGQGIISDLVASIPVNPFVKRYIDSVGVIFSSGSDDLNTYVTLSQPSLTINQDPPSFSDVTNGIGLFTSRHIQTLNKLISGELVDSLTSEPRLLPLNFQI